MPDNTWEVVDEVAGDLQAEIVRGLLESYGIEVWISQEGAGRVYQFGVGALGRAQILVPYYQGADARKILGKYYAGELIVPDENSEDGEDET